MFRAFNLSYVEEVVDLRDFIGAVALYALILISYKHMRQASNHFIYLYIMGCYVNSDVSFWEGLGIPCFMLGNRHTNAAHALVLGEGMNRVSGRDVLRGLTSRARLPGVGVSWIGALGLKPVSLETYHRLRLKSMWPVSFCRIHLMSTCLVWPVVTIASI